MLVQYVVNIHACLLTGDNNYNVKFEQIKRVHRPWSLYRSESCQYWNLNTDDLETSVGGVGGRGRGGGVLIG